MGGPVSESRDTLWDAVALASAASRIALMAISRSSGWIAANNMSRVRGASGARPNIARQCFVAHNVSVMVVQADGKYKASTTRGTTTEGQFYLQDGKLRYRSSRTTGTAKLSEDKGKTTLTVIADNPDYGKAEYERIRQ